MSAVEKFLEANAEFEVAKRELTQIADGLQHFASVLQKAPDRTYFSNIGEGGELPPEVTMIGGANGFDAHLWPTPIQIQAAIRRRFNAKNAVQAAWGAIPPEHRVSLVGPKF